MSGLKKFFSDEVSGKRTLRLGDSSNGLECNNIVHTHRVSRKIYDVDIARTPRIIRGIGYPEINIQNSARYANRYNPMVNYKAHRCKGTGGW